MPEETNAKKVIEFEVMELENEHLLDDLSVSLGCDPTLEAIKAALDARFGKNAIAMWLCDSPEWARKRYGSGEAYPVEIPSGAIVGSDLGADGKLWIWRARASFKGGLKIGHFGLCKKQGFKPRFEPSPLH